MIRTALKEWASVIDAFAAGRQLVMIRKGGLIEPGSGFELRARQFVFYPTFEHQTITYVREPFRAACEAALKRKPADGLLRLGCYGVAAHSARVLNPAVIKRLEPFHLYNDAFLEQRLRWQPEQPLVVVVVRAFRLPAEQVIAMAPHYAGCTSWIELDAPVAIEGAQPAVDDAAFQRQLGRVTALLG